jgi:hypothetical protein
VRYLSLELATVCADGSIVEAIWLLFTFSVADKPVIGVGSCRFPSGTAISISL